MHHYHTQKCFAMHMEYRFHVHRHATDVKLQKYCFLGCLFYFFSQKPKKKSLGSGGKNRVGRVTRNINIFFFGLNTFHLQLSDIEAEGRGIINRG